MALERIIFIIAAALLLEGTHATSNQDVAELDLARLEQPEECTHLIQKRADAKRDSQLHETPEYDSQEENRGSIAAAVTPRRATMAGEHSSSPRISEKATKLFSKFLKLCSEGAPAFFPLKKEPEPFALKVQRHKAIAAPLRDGDGKRIADDEVNIEDLPGMKLVDVFLILAFGIFGFKSLSDIWRFFDLMREKKQDDAPVATNMQETIYWSTTELIGLTAYRFYTGFLTATWLPYLLAMEGQYLWASNQSMFMGCAKLIYGATILTNPILGLVGDRAVILSHGIGRRLFVRIGVGLAAVGILVCMIAAQIEYFYTFMIGIFIWRMGEAINDVTTEALVPELVGAEQFQTASAVKAAMFLFGGLFGYLLLIAAARLHYSWLYYAYLVGMFVSSIPVLIMLSDDSPRVPINNNRRQETSFISEMTEAYLGPARAEGGFPRACLAVFIFSLGTAPMFFLLLIVRDIVGIKDAVQLQEHFSGSSIMFFVSAALAAVLSGAGPPRPQNPSAQRPNSSLSSSSSMSSLEPEDSPLVKSMIRMVWSVTMFALICFIVPWIGLVPSQEARKIIFYVIAAIFGYSFGLSFSQFQGITWQLLPQGIDLANAMGFNVMSRLLGLGVGNFIAGLILDFFYVDTVAPEDPTAPRQAEGEYLFIGYVFMCTASGMLTLVAAGLSYSIVLQYRGQSEKETQSALMAVAG